MKKLVPKITDYMENCVICGAPAEWHHVIHTPNGSRDKASEDGLLLPLCPAHHQTGKDAAHASIVTDRLCNIIGELAYERNVIASGEAASVEEARDRFRERYGRNRL